MTDAQSAQQALDVLQRVRAKVLLELWTTIMLCGGMAAIAVSQLCQLLGLRRTAACFVMLYGYAMTWVPAAIAPWFGYGTMVVAFAIIVKESLKLSPHPKIKAT
jgi:predicted PurR-regulated permease PerM